MNASPTWLQMLAMLWTGRGLEQAFPWLPQNVRMTIALGLPLLFKLALAVLGTGILYRIFFASPRSGDRHVRGARLTTARMAWLKSGFRPPSKLVIGGVGWPRKLEPLHLLVSGAPGTGKSQTILRLINAMGGRKDRGIVTDVGGEALCRLGETGDRLLNPLDRRSSEWSPFAEIDTAADTERLAKSMIPDYQRDQNPEWVGYSQGLVSAVLRRLWEQRAQGRATNGALLHALTLAAPSELEALVSGLPVQALFHAGADRMMAKDKATPERSNITSSVWCCPRRSRA
jgi:hypothetical protein